MRCILFVEDDLLVRTLLRQLLLQTYPDCRVLAAPTGRAFLAQLPAAQPDLILLDGHLPDTTGIALYHAVRQHASLREVPVLFITGDPEMVQHARLVGIYRCLAKPFTAADLFTHVRALQEQAPPLSA